jgi:ABC-type transport system substrate-binding protein
MPRRLWPPVVMLVLGASLIATAAGNSLTFKEGGIFKVAAVGPSVSIDPQVAYVTTAWWLENATAAKLFNYPDKAGYAGTLLQPEVAFGFRLSRDGKTYSFTIRSGFRFSDGKPVTAKSFKFAIDRTLVSDLASPGASFITDPNGANVVGVIAKGDKLIIKLEKPDPTLITKLAMPFFQATSTKLPLSKEVTTAKSIRDMPTAGPYAFSRAVPDKVTKIVRNPYWTSGPGRHRPRHLAGLQITWALDEETAYQQTLENNYDEGPLPAAHVSEVADRFGVNKTRFWIKPIGCLGFIAFNNSAGLFAGNPAMRKAVNWALDRTDYVAQAGLYVGSPWTHILPPGVPGSITAKSKQPYSARSNLEKAQVLAAGHFKDGTIRILYGRNGTITPNQASIVRGNLIDLGFQPDKIIMIPWSPIDPPPADWDLRLSIGWCADSADPYDFFQFLLVEPYLLNPKWGAKVKAAAKLTGAARLKAFGKLDLEIMRNAAPFAPMRTYNNRYFFSNRVDPRSLVYQGVYSDWSIPALALK